MDASVIGGGGPLSLTQTAAANNLLEDLMWFCRSSATAKEALGGGRKQLLERISAVSKADLNSEVDLSSLAAVAQRVNLDRVAIPEPAGALNPAEYLNPWQREIFENYHD